MGIDVIAAAEPGPGPPPPDQPVGFDSSTPLYIQQLFPARSTSFAVVTGVEAEMIKAERDQGGSGGGRAHKPDNLAQPHKIENTLTLRS